MKISSKAFKHNEYIPSIYTCDSKDISPPISFDDIPVNTKSMVLIVDDPDAPSGIWVHWVLYNISPGTSGLEENIPHREILSGGEMQGINDFKKTGYGGPCPPSGTHRYFFKLYALDENLNLKPSMSKKQIEQAIESHIIEKAELIGKYKR